MDCHVQVTFGRVGMHNINLLTSTFQLRQQLLILKDSSVSAVSCDQ